MKVSVKTNTKRIATHKKTREKVQLFSSIFFHLNSLSSIIYWVKSEFPENLRQFLIFLQVEHPNICFDLSFQPFQKNSLNYHKYLNEAPLPYCTLCVCIMLYIFIYSTKPVSRFWKGTSAWTIYFHLELILSDNRTTKEITYNQVIYDQSLHKHIKTQLPM